jgi:hypothetical protein
MGINTSCIEKIMHLMWATKKENQDIHMDVYKISINHITFFDIWL